jgi:hypothetical protein
VRDHKGRPFAVPSQINRNSNGDPYPRRTPEGTRDGTAGAALCGFCYGWTMGESEWPPVKIIEARRDGVRITTKVIDEVRAAS